MTLPVERILPPVPDFEDVQEAKKYLHDLNFELQDMYEGIVQNVNGFIRNDQDIDGSSWIPTISSTGTQGTITYIHQNGWSLRQGIITEIWFDVNWSAIGSSTGNLYIELPYLVTKTENKPFVGVIQYGSITLGGAYTNLVINAIGSTYRGEIWRTRPNGSSTTNLSIPSSGLLRGNLRYLGVEDE